MTGKSTRFVLFPGITRCAWSSVIPGRTSGAILCHADLHGGCTWAYFAGIVFGADSRPECHAGRTMSRNREVPPMPAGSRRESAACVVRGLCSMRALWFRVGQPVESSVVRRLFRRTPRARRRTDKHFGHWARPWPRTACRNSLIEGTPPINGRTSPSRPVTESPAPSRRFP